MKEQAIVFLNTQVGDSSIYRLPTTNTTILTFEVEVEDEQKYAVVVDDFSVNVKRMQELREITIREAAAQLLIDNPELKEKLDRGDYLSLGDYWFVWNKEWVLLDACPTTTATKILEKEKKEEKGVQMIKKPVWREIRFVVMAPSASGGAQEYFPIHLTRFARSVASLVEREKITDAKVGDLVYSRLNNMLFVCTDIEEVEEPKQSGRWIEIKLEGADFASLPKDLGYFFDLTPGCLVRCGDRFFDEDEQIILDTIEERDRLDGILDGQYVQVGDKLFMYVKNPDALKKE